MKALSSCDHMFIAWILDVVFMFVVPSFMYSLQLDRQARSANAG